MFKQPTEKQLWRTRLGNRELFVLLLMPALTALVLFAYFTLRYSRAQAETQIVSRLSDAADVSTALIDQELANTQTLIVTYSQGYSLRQSISSPSASSPNKNALADLWETTNTNNQNLDFIVAVDMNGKPVMAEPKNLSTVSSSELLEMPSIKAALAGQPYTSASLEVANLPGFKEPLIITSVPIFDQTNTRIIGAIIAGNKLTVMEDFIKQLGESEGVEITFYDKNNQPIISAVQPDAKALVQEERISYLNQARQGKEVSGEGKNLQSKDTFVLYQPLGNEGWVIATEFQKQNLLKQLEYGRFSIFLFIVILALLLIGGTLYALQILSTYQKELNTRVRQLETANQALEMFSRTLTHDLKNSTASIYGLSEQLMLRSGEDDTLFLIAKTIKDSTLKMQALINDALVLAQVAQTPERENITLLPILQEAGVGINDIEINYPEDMEISAQKTAILRACQNLIENASHYGRSADGILRLDISARQEKGATVLCFRDYGPGVKKEDQDKIFSAFKRGTEGSSRPGGTGLGLSIVASVAQAHGGTVSVDEPEEGPGACFYLTLGEPAPSEMQDQ